MKEDLFAEFPKVTSEQWHDKIAKDLKGRSPDEMAWSPDQQLRLNPYVHADDIKAAIQGYEGFGKWKIGESFTVTDESKCNQQLHEALRGGVESLNLQCKSAVNWNQLLEGIKLPMIHLGIEMIGNQNGLEGFFSYANSRYPSQELHTTLYSGDQVPRSKVRYCNIPMNLNSVVDGIISVINGAINGANGNYTLCAQRDLSITVGMHYLVEIARLRALRILWKNVADALSFHISSDFAIEAHVVPDLINDESEKQMIRNTVRVLAAVLGGADRIYVDNTNNGNERESFHRHIARNIHHLLRYESKMPEVTDPLFGSYYIDNLTREIVERSWLELSRTGF